MIVRGAAVVAVLALAGCGGNDSTGASAASVVPANATVYAELDSDLDSAQWERVQSLLDRFPSRPQLVEKLNEQLRSEDLDYEDDVEPALGDTVVVATFPDAVDELVLLTQPDDDDKWRALVERAAEDDEVVFGEVDGWQAAAESQAALDRARNGEGSLADDDGFVAALDELPDERLAFVWGRGDALGGLATFAVAPRGTYYKGGEIELDWAAAAVEAREDGAAISLVARGPAAESGEAYDSERADAAPSDAFAFLSFRPEAYAKQLEQLPEDVRAFVAELEGESAVWVRPGGGFPEVTAVLGTKDAQRAKAAFDELTGTGPQSFLPLRSGVVDGDLVVTTARSLEAAVREPSESLADSEDLKDARDAAGMPEETGGFLFVNVADALPLLSLAGFAGLDVPEEGLDAARAIRSIVAWSEPSDDGGRFELFVHIE